MHSASEKLIEERLALLPPYIRSALSNINWGAEILAIGKKNGLHVDDMGTLQTETVLVLVGLVHPDEFPHNLAEQLHVPKEKINAIVTDVNEKILKTIRQSLIEFIAQENEKPAIPEPHTEREEQTEQDIFHKTGIELDPETTPMAEQAMPIGDSVGLAERSILEHSGVEVAEDMPSFEPYKNPGTHVERQDILTEIEHPTKTSATQFSNLIRTKLSDAVITEPQKTKYEDKKPMPTVQKSDPYREQI